jgi:hypothetical protein
MKRMVFLFLMLVSSKTVFAQYLDFAPIGSTWYYVNGGPPGFCPPNVYYKFTVTQDTIIQGKYCTRIENHDWPCDAPLDPTYVHSDSGKVYRYDINDQTFYLAIDFTKEVHETWTVKVCPSDFFCDSLVMKVLFVDGIKRRIGVTCGDDYQEFEVYEGMGNVLAAYSKLMIHYIFATDCGTSLLCFEHPTAGFIYGAGGASCLNATEDPNTPPSSPVSVYPNPAQQMVNVSFSQPLSQKADWRFSDSMGRVLHQSSFATGGTDYVVSLPELPSGLYFWSMSAAGARAQGGKLIISK